MRSTCRRCGGSGNVIKNPCRKCNGAGNIMETRKITVPVPAGIALFPVFWYKCIMLAETINVFIIVPTKHHCKKKCLG